MVPVIDLLPHVEVIVSSCIELKRHSSDIVEHQVRAEHITDVGQGPRDLLGNAGYDVEQYLECDYEDEMNGPCTYEIVYQSPAYCHVPIASPGEAFRTFGVNPLRVEIRERRLIADML